MGVVPMPITRVKMQLILGNMRQRLGDLKRVGKSEWHRSFQRTWGMDSPVTTTWTQI
jgi:hypothetical protein